MEVPSGKSGILMMSDERAIRIINSRRIITPQEHDLSRRTFLAGGRPGLHYAPEEKKRLKPLPGYEHLDTTKGAPWRDFTRRAFLNGSLSALAASSLLWEKRAWAFRLRGGGNLPSGFLPSGHWIMKQSMIQVYPQPDADTPSWARHHWAYYDGTNAVQYNIPIGVSFGAYPYVVTAFSGPSWLTIGTVYSASNYLLLTGTPTGSYSGTVSLTLTGQDLSTVIISFLLQTDGAAPASGGHFCFMNADSGSDSNNGTYASPWLTPAHVFGTSYGTSGTRAGAGPADSICVAQGATAHYVMPIYSDNTFSSSAPYFEFNSAYKPHALIGITGQNATFDTTGFTFTNGSDDLYVADIILNGTDASELNSRGFYVSGAARQTFTGITCNNPVYGTGGSSNASMFFMSGPAGPGQPLSNFGNYAYITRCAENGRNSGTVGNNYSGCSFYGFQNSLVEFNSATSVSASVDSVWYFKSDCYNCSMRANFAHFTGCSHGFDFGQAPDSFMSNSESCYNIGINVNGIFLPQTGGFTYGPLYAYRNNIIGNKGLASNESNSGGPYAFDANAVQTSNSPVPPTGTSIQTTVPNVVAASGMLDSTTGNFTSTYLAGNPGALGTVGAQIA